MGDFSSDLASNLDEMADHRKHLLDAVSALSTDDMMVTRRGGWSVREVLHHVIDAEVSYTKVIGFLRSAPVDVPNATDADVASPEAASEALRRSRQQLLASLEGVDESTFYDLRALGKEQYSVVSVLENVAAHDHEHLVQLKKTLAT